MKTSLITLAFALVSSLVLAQTTTENYVKSTTYQVETTDGINKTNTSTPLIDENKIESITYLDGLGRPIQSVSPRAGGNKETIYSHMTYDQFGRQIFSFLPVPSTNELSSSNHLDFYNDLQLPLEDKINDYYTNKFPEDQITSTTINAFSQTRFESSPLNRVLEQGAPGKDWLVNETLDTDHTIKFDYHFNGFEEVRLFSVTFPNTNTDEPQLSYDYYYSSNELYKTITKDENWTSGNDHTTEEFKNTNGQVILKRTYDDNKAHDTYYVYDDFGNLTFVLSPEGSEIVIDSNDNIDQFVLDKLCYQYRYDYKNRLIEKKIPQKEWEYIVYDVLDHPILIQDANLRANDDWLFTKYDKYDRVIYTGKHHFIPNGSNDNSGRIELQDDVTNAARSSEPKLDDSIVINGTTIFYENKNIPKVDIDIYTVNYYDDYNWDTGYNFEASYDRAEQSFGFIIDGNKIINIVNTEFWDQGFITDAEINDDGYIQWTAHQNDKTYMIGLSKAGSTPDNGYLTIDYGIMLTNEGTVLIYEDGINQNISANITYNLDDVFRVERSMGQITYYQNDIAIHASATPSTGNLVGDTSFYSFLATVRDVFIGYSSLGQPFTSNVKGLPTGGKVRVLGTNDWMVSSTYYDEKARSVYSISKNNYLSTIDAVSTYYDFTGKVIKSHNSHNNQNSKSIIVTIDNFIYDHSGRLLRQEQKVNNENKQLIAKNNYDKLGQLVQKQVGGTLPNVSNYNFPINVDIASNTITKKTSSSDSWTNSGVSTLDNITGDGYVSFSGNHHTEIVGTFACGLSYTDTDRNWTSIDYALYMEASGFVSVRESGTDRGVKTSYVPGDMFIVERRDTTIYYLKNGEPFYVSEIQATTAPMIGDLSIYSSGATVNDFFIVDLEKELQEVDYTYNIRGWLKSINDIEDLGVVGGANSDLFAFKINYNTHELGGTPLYNGNISETLWNTLSVNPNTQEYKRKRGYDYTYDALNRIKDADFHKLSGVERDNYYNLSNISYDRNGNIITLARSGVDNSGSLIEDMDDLTYAYDGNQLYDISEAGNHSYGFKDFENNQNLDYTYDANGNMTYDYNKEILISYNHLNLPTSVVKSSQELITYIYDATGVKQSKSVTEDTNTTITDYANNFIYKDSKLEFFSHPEGYTEYDGKNYDYIYQYKDHLGNIRLSYSDINNNGKIETSSEIIEENNYYPFGLKHKGYNNVINGTDHPYGFGGMEEQDELGLGWIDITARNYDPALGRWMNLDLMSEAQYSFSPYHYAYNSPIAYSDPTGMIGESDTTTVVNGDDPTQTFVVDDGYDFEFVVDSDVFNKIKETGSIKGTGAYYRWFFEAVGHEVKKTDGSATDEVASFVLYDTVGDVIIALSEKDIGKGVLNIAAGKLKKLKKFARWLKKNKGKKIPGTKQGGGQFKNKEGNLPKTDANGKEVTYQKYDVNPAPQHGATRGTERMVTGTDGKVYYTNDHYKTFTEIKPDGN